jgi:hypothetical protein
VLDAHHAGRPRRDAFGGALPGERVSAVARGVARAHGSGPAMLTGRPATRVPMPPIGRLGIICGPGHDVRTARGQLLVTPRTAVRGGRRRTRHRAHLIVQPLPGFYPPVARAETTTLGLAAGASAGGRIAAGHDPRVFGTERCCRVEHSHKVSRRRSGHHVHDRTAASGRHGLPRIHQAQGDFRVGIQR